MKRDRTDVIPDMPGGSEAGTISTCLPPHCTRLEIKRRSPFPFDADGANVMFTCSKWGVMRDLGVSEAEPVRY